MSIEFWILLGFDAVVFLIDIGLRIKFEYSQKRKGV
jgi:hypothetical protein